MIFLVPYAAPSPGGARRRSLSGIVHEGALDNFGGAI